MDDLRALINELRKFDAYSDGGTLYGLAADALDRLAAAGKVIDAAEHLCAVIGAYGEVNSRSNAVSKLMDALYAHDAAIAARKGEG